MEAANGWLELVVPSSDSVGMEGQFVLDRVSAFRPGAKPAQRREVIGRQLADCGCTEEVLADILRPNRGSPWTCLLSRRPAADVGNETLDLVVGDKVCLVVGAPSRFCSWRLVVGDSLPRRQRSLPLLRALAARRRRHLQRLRRRRPFPLLRALVATRAAAGAAPSAEAQTVIRRRQRLPRRGRSFPLLRRALAAR